MKQIGRALAAVTVAFSFNISTAVASSQAARTLEQLVDESQAIVLGEPIAAQAVWADGGLVTRYTVRVAETLKGTHEAQIVVSIPGGVDMNRRVPIARIVPGAPALIANQQVLLMLQRPSAAKSADYRILGFNQGVLNMSASAAPASASQVSRSARGASVVPDGSTLSAVSTAPARSATPTVDAFDRVRQRIRDIQNRVRN